MYVHHSISSVVQPVIALRGFRRVHLDAGKSVAVTFDIGAEELSILDAQMKRTVEPGEVDVLVGANSAESSAVQVTVVLDCVKFADTHRVIQMGSAHISWGKP